MQRIEISPGKYALVDDQDYPELIKFSWYLHSRKGKNHTVQYARCWKLQCFMHRLIMKAEPNQIVDHINGNGLDNRRCNLRIVTVRQNTFNKGSYKGASKYKGVYWNKYHGKWSAEIRIGTKKVFLGYHENEKDAAVAYDQKAKELFGEYARLNFRSG